MRPYPIHCVSIVIPVYNEQESLPELLRRTGAACEQLRHPYEIVLVDDGSRDDSAHILEAAAQAENSPFVAVILNRNYGQHAAIMAGFEQCKGDVVITLDADLQNPPEEIPRLVAEAERGFDVVGTVRSNRQDSALRRWPSKVINYAVKRSTGVAMSDYGCMLRAYRRTVIDAMLACRERSTFIPILANSFARHTTEILVTHAEREHGDSKYSPMRLISLMFDLITCMTTTPLRLLSIDLRFPGLDCIDRLTELRQLLRRTTLIIVSMVDEPALIEHVMASGVDGFIGKSIAPDELGAAILAIRDGEVLVKYSPSGLLPNLGSGNELEHLTHRQHEVLRLIAQGKTNKEIARALDISPFTVRIHVSSLLKALNVTSRTAAAVKYSGT